MTEMALVSPSIKIPVPQVCQPVTYHFPVELHRLTFGIEIAKINIRRVFVNDTIK